MKWKNRTNLSLILRDVEPDGAFIFSNGTVVRNIYELVKEIELIDNQIFLYHCNDVRDDFAAWIGGTLEDIRLSESLRKIKDKKQYVNAIKRRIDYLEHCSDAPNSRNFIKAMFMNKFKNWKIIQKMSVIIIISIISLSVYDYYKSTRRVDIVTEQAMLIEQQDACFNTYLDKEIFSGQRILENKLAERKQPECTYTYAFSIFEDYEYRPATIPDKDIFVLDDRVIILINVTSWAHFENTSSMLPVINHNTRSIEIKPKTIEDIHVGDIVSYRYEDGIVAHRVVNIGTDDIGSFLITKGDNNPFIDQEKVRFEQVEGVVVALIY